jgi:hypothetical protein
MRIASQLSPKIPPRKATFWQHRSTGILPVAPTGILPVDRRNSAFDVCLPLPSSLFAFSLGACHRTAPEYFRGWAFASREADGQNVRACAELKRMRSNGQAFNLRVPPSTLSLSVLRSPFFALCLFRSAFGVRCSTFDVCLPLRSSRFASFIGRLPSDGPEYFRGWAFFVRFNPSTLQLFNGLRPSPSALCLFHSTFGVRRSVFDVFFLRFLTL